MHRFKYILLALITFTVWLNIGLGQDSNNMDAELEKEMAAQREQYQELVKSLGAEELINDPEIKKMMDSGSLNFDKLENTIRKIQKKRASRTMGAFEPPSFSELLKGGAVGAMTKTLTPFRSISESDLEKSLVNNLEEGSAKRILKRNPKLVTLIARLLKSEKALPSLAGILDDKNKLYTFLFINVALFVFLKLRRMIINRKNSQSKYYKKSFFDSFVGWVVATCIVFAIRIGIFVYFFGDEAGPAWEVFKTSMFA